MKDEINKYLEQNKTSEFKSLLFSFIDEKNLNDSKFIKESE